MKSNKFYRKNIWGLIFVTPFLLVFLSFQIYPILYSFYLGFTEYSGFTNARFIGLGNFQKLFYDPVFKLAVFNTFYIWIVCFVFQLLSAFYFSGIFHYMKIKGLKIWHAIFYFPNLVSSAAIALIFLNLFSRDSGLINSLFVHLGYQGESISWMGNKWTARGIVSLMIWMQFFGVFILYISSAIAAIPSSLFESANIDGCTPFKAFLLITLPILRPIIFYILVTSLVGGLQIFEQPYLLTAGTGSPEDSLTTMIFYLYRKAFYANQMGYGASVGIILFFLILLGTGGINRANKFFKEKYI